MVSNAKSNQPTGILNSLKEMVNPNVVAAFNQFNQTPGETEALEKVARTNVHKGAATALNESINPMGLDFQALSKNPERETIKSQSSKRLKNHKSKSNLRPSKDKNFDPTEEYCAIAHTELKEMLASIKEPEKFDFYAHLHEIAEKFPERQMDHIANYFNLLVTYIRKNKSP